MNLATNFERRVASLIAEYADRAPTDVDPLAMARLVAASGVPTSVPFVFGFRLPRLGLVLLALAVAIALIGTVLVSGTNPFRRLETWTPVEGVPPFIGLPPVGAAASVPETGELVLRSTARMPALGTEAQQSFLYADGRLIWQRNLEGSESAQAIFGDLDPTRALIEQRLTQEGVALVRANVLASMIGPARGWRGGHQPWGRIEVVLDGRLQTISWSDADLPGRLADPGTWLPASAWADRELRGYVPSRYALCLWGDTELGDLPAAAVQMLRDRAASAGPGLREISTCYEVATEVARDTITTLETAQFERCDAVPNQTYGRPSRHPTEQCSYSGVSIFEILPDGEIFLFGG